MSSNRSDSGASPGKIFIGGLSKETVIDTFVKYFAKYGDITDSVVMKDRMTGRPRGFGFITYADPSVVDTVIAETHVIDGKQVEIKRTTPKGSSESKDIKTKKIFVGGIPTVLTEDEFKDFFSKYGNVTEHEIIRDHETNRSRGFGFISFESEQTVDEVLTNGNRIDLNGTQVEIKKAEPKKPSNPGPLSHIRESRGRGRGYGGSYDGFDDSYGGYDGGYDGGNGGGYGGGSGYGPPPPFRSYRGLPSRFGDYDPYGPSAREYGSRYSEYAGDYGSYRGGEPPVGNYPSRFSSYGSGGYDGGYGGRGLGGYGRGVGGGYGGFGGPGGDGGYEPGAGAGAGVGSGSGLDYGGAGGPYRAGYSGGSRYNPYGR